MKRQMKESPQRSVEIEGMQMLIVLGPDLQILELSIEEGIVALGSVEV
jgi:hypothetical protein